MKQLLILFLLLLMLVTAPAMADTDTFTIKTLYSPTHYLFDYGETSTARVTNYSIESSTNLIANQTWIMLASNNKDTIDILDNRYNISFAAGVAQDFVIATPDYYRFYYLVFNDGFYDPSTILTLTLYSTINESSIMPSSSTKIIRPTETNYLPIILLGIVIVILFIMYMKRRY